MTASNRDRDADQIFRRAQAAQNAQRGGGIRFKSATAAVGWYFETRERLASPHGMHPRGEVLPDGSVARIEVDGGPGGDLDEVLATMATIGKALGHLQRSEPSEHFSVVHKVRDGWTGAQSAKVLQCDRKTAGAHLARGLRFLTGVLLASDMLVLHTDEPLQSTNVQRSA